MSRGLPRSLQPCGLSQLCDWSTDLGRKEGVAVMRHAAFRPAGTGGRRVQEVTSLTVWSAVRAGCDLQGSSLRCRRHHPAAVQPVDRHGRGRSNRRSAMLATLAV